MKMNFKSMLIAALAMTTMLASCSKDGEGANTKTGDDRAVQIKINRATAGNPGSRSIGNQVADDTPVTFTSGYLLFTDQTDIVRFVVTINAGSAAYVEASKTVGVEALEATGGEWITGVPGVAHKVYFLGNKPSDVAVPAAGTTNVANLVTAVSTQWKNDGSVDNVTLFGGEDITKYTGTGAQADEYEAEFDVKPIVGRFEIGAITGVGNITDYQIDGIFIDNYYGTMNLNGNATATLEENGTGSAKYMTDGVGGSYLAALQGVVYDYAAGGLTIPDRTPVAPPATMEAWSYNLFAPTSASPAMPSIVIRLSNVEVNGQPWNGSWFLTIQNFYSDPGTNQVDIDKMEQGKIYVISNVAFDEDDITTEPYQKTKKVRVEVNMLNWESDEVGFDFD